MDVTTKKLLILLPIYVGLMLFFVFLAAAPKYIQKMKRNARDEFIKIELAELEATFPPAEPILAVLLETDAPKEGVDGVLAVSIKK